MFRAIFGALLARFGWWPLLEAKKETKIIQTLASTAIIIVVVKVSRSFVTLFDSYAIL